MSYFLEPFTSKNKVQVELNLSNYATKSDLKNATSVDILHFAKKDDLANLKTEFDRLDIDELETNQVDLQNLNNVVDKKIVKKDVYDTDKNCLDKKIEDVENKIPGVGKLVNNNALNKKI